MAKKVEVVLEQEVHAALLTDREAQERAADDAVRRAVREDGLTRKEAERVYGVRSKKRRSI